MGDLAAISEADDLASIEAREDRGESVVVVLGPAIERVIVTVCAPQLGTEERFAHELGLLPRTARHPGEPCRSDLVAVSRRREELACESVEAEVARDLAPYPGVEAPRGLLIACEGTHVEEALESKRPEVGEGWIGEEAIDEPHAACEFTVGPVLVAVIVLEGFDLARERQAAGEQAWRDGRRSHPRPAVPARDGAIRGPRG